MPVLNLLLLAAVMAQEPVNFETEVRPVIRGCWACHSETVASSGLSLERRASILKGGNRGA